MHIQSIQLLETPNSTLSAMLVEGNFQCFVLEDGHRDKKVMGETRIPEGVYIVKARTEGKIFNSLKNRLKCKFVPHLIGVPGFEYILIHPGNSVADTRGCLMVGDMTGLDASGNFYLKNSTPAYEKLYREIEVAFAHGETVSIEIMRAGKELERLREFGKALAGAV